MSCCELHCQKQCLYKACFAEKNMQLLITMHEIIIFKNTVGKNFTWTMDSTDAMMGHIMGSFKKIKWSQTIINWYLAYSYQTAFIHLHWIAPTWPNYSPPSDSDGLIPPQSWLYDCAILYSVEPSVLNSSDATTGTTVLP